MAGLIPTKNAKLIQLHKMDQRLSAILNTPVNERDPDGVADLKNLIKRALEDVITTADVLFTTAVMFTS
jgi:hypothetical protein